MNDTSIYVEVDFAQHRKSGEAICGDTFLSKKIPEEERVVAVMSDGLGSGVKANILAGMTASMAMKFAVSDMDFLRSAEVMMNALPICQVRKISYATFTLLDTRLHGKTRLLEMGNPQCLFIRNGEILENEFDTMVSPAWQDRTIRRFDFTTQPEDRIVIFSDGITQAGLGGDWLKLGWRRKGCADYVRRLLRANPTLSARKLAEEVVREATRVSIDHRIADDMTCAVVYYRQPRQLLVISGPPFDQGKDIEIARMIRDFPGRKVISGGTTAQIVSRELGREIETQLNYPRRELPAISRMKGIDLVSEGILTLTAAARYMEMDQPPTLVNGAAEMVNLFLASDIIRLVIGTRVNEAHQDPSLPVELDIRRNIIKRIAHLLESRYLKEVHIEYI